MNLLNSQRNCNNFAETERILAAISPWIRDFKLENEFRNLLAFFETSKRHSLSNKENFPVSCSNICKKARNFCNIPQKNANFPLQHPKTANSLANSKEISEEERNKYLKKLVGLNFSQTIETIEEPQENLPIINDISLIKEENPSQITMIEHSEFSQNNTFLQKEDTHNESSFINCEEKSEM